MKKVLVILMGILLVLTVRAEAGLLDLSDPTDIDTSPSGAIFKVTDINGQGSGNMDSFLRIQANPTEQGYNTDGSVKLDTKGGSHTHAISFNDIPVVTLNGNQYLEFLIDLNDNDHTLQIDSIRIFLGDSDDYNSYDPVGDSWTDTLSKYFDLDLPASDYFLTVNNIPNGSGKADVYAYLPYDAAAGESNPYLYFYTKISGTNPGGFDEVGVGVQGENPPPPAVPEPASLLLLGGGLVSAFLRKRIV